VTMRRPHPVEGSRSAPLSRQLDRLRLVACTSLLIATAACAHQGGATVRQVSFSGAQVAPPSLMIAQRIKRPLYLVLDPRRVADAWPVMVRGRTATVTDFQLFVTRDLKGAMQTYFDRVEVVRVGEPIPDDAIIGDVKIDRIQIHDINTGRLTYSVLEMTWGFAMRPKEATDYAFSFAGTETSSEAYPTLVAGCAQMAESALSAMLSKWVNDRGLEQVRRAAG
jgi:hypothetical protein